MTKVVVGQKLWFQSRNGQSHEVVVSRVGRKWAEVHEKWLFGRFDAVTLKRESGYDGALWLSKADYDASLALDVAWVAFVRDIGASRGWSTRPKNLTIDKINAARLALGLAVTP